MRLTLAVLGVHFASLTLQAETPNLWDTSLEDILSMSVTTAGRKPQTVAKTAASVFVITQEDIRRSTATSIPDLLRMVPGLHVARTSASNELTSYAVGGRDVVSTVNGDLLVLIDGRSVLNDTYYGINWDTEVLLEDIDRIEVVRGPGTVLWGSNAIEAVINIVRKPASQTKGKFVQVRAGTEERLYSSVRYGDSINDTDYRIYGFQYQRDNMRRIGGGQSRDAQGPVGQLGFRSDTSISKTDSFSWQGDMAYRENETRVGVPSLEVPGDFNSREGDAYTTLANTLARWKQTHSETSATELQGYVVYNNRDWQILGQEEQIYGIDLQHRFAANDWLEFVVGTNGKQLRERYTNTLITRITPSDQSRTLTNAYVQTESQLLKDRVSLFLGGRYERGFFGDEVWDPDARLLWTPNERSTVWLSATKATRNLPLFDKKGSLSLQSIPVDEETTGLLTLDGASSLDTRPTTTYQLGYKRKFTDVVEMDVVSFHTKRENFGLASAGIVDPYLADVEGNVVPVVPLANDQILETESSGGEISLSVKPTSSIRFAAGYAHLYHTTYCGKDNCADSFSEVTGFTVGNEANLRAMFSLTQDVDFNLAFRYVDSMPNVPVGAYTQADAKLAYRPQKNLELAVVGQNLLRPATQEYSPEYFQYDFSKIERGVFGQVTYTF